LNFTSGVVQLPINLIEWTSEFVRRKWSKECLQLDLRATRQVKKLQEKKIPSPTTSCNDVLPSPIIIPAKPDTQAKGAQLAFTTVCVLQQSLLHAMSPGNHIYHIIVVCCN
jgi:hypothetical protein